MHYTESIYRQKDKDRIADKWGEQETVERRGAREWQYWVLVAQNDRSYSSESRQPGEEHRLC